MINLTYNSANKNGWVGVGWELNMGAIQRSTKKLDYNANDFIVAAAGQNTELVFLGGYDYKAKIENKFTEYFGFVNVPMTGEEKFSRAGFYLKVKKGESSDAGSVEEIITNKDLRSEVEVTLFKATEKPLDKDGTQNLGSFYCGAN